MKKLLSVFMAVLLIVAIALPCSAKAESEAFLTTALNSGSIYAQQQNTILVRTDDGTGTKLTTISKILGYLFGTEKDYNYFYTFVVEKDGSGKWRVTQANNTLALGAG
ncbi:MAG TPA: hypothetical protein PLT66_08675, partial [Bacillota bacterium]|nr:hypothetical protein [Bacillota bacterium]